MKAPLLLYYLFCAVFIIAQDNSDAVRLKNMSYMRLAGSVSCDDHANSMLEQRICLNLEFQSVDSIMNLKFTALLAKFEEESVQTELKAFQKAWVENRRLQSKLVSTGYRGHMLGIYYLDCMVKTTNRRIEEIEYLLRTE